MSAFTIYNPHIRTTETDTHVFFHGGPFGQWTRSAFHGSLPDRKCDLHFNCAEQYMMAAKADFFEDFAAFWDIMEADHPRDQKAVGRRVQNFDQERWERVCVGIVKQANLLKFQQNKAMQFALLGSKGKMLVEGARDDQIWGVGIAWDDERIIDPSNWRGRNLLGKVLMEVRTELATA
jgi:ribA/ribD-fused uncharacterized protein